VSSEDGTVVRVAMAKRVAQAWLEKKALPEHRVAVYSGSDKLGNIPALLKSFRDGKSKIAGVPTIKDLGVKTEFDKITFKSRDKEALLKLDAWLVAKGCETSGIW
jgi:hypothetical protein